MNNIKDKIMIYVGYNKYISQDNIISVFDLDTAKENRLIFKNKNVINLDDENVKSYIYCKDNIIIGIPLTAAFIKKEINRNIKLLYSEFKV